MSIVELIDLFGNFGTHPEKINNKSINKKVLIIQAFKYSNNEVYNLLLKYKL